MLLGDALLARGREASCSPRCELAGRPAPRRAAPTPPSCRRRAAAAAAPPGDGSAALPPPPAAAPATSAPALSLLVAPEDFTLPPGALGPILRSSSSPAAPADAFRCVGCVDPACGGPAAACAAAPWRLAPLGYLRATLTAKVYDVAVETPLQRAAGLSDKLGSTILLKREDLQPVKSFKLRGAYNRMAQLSPAQLAAGVVCSSAGNHAQGVALAAARLGADALIVMPTTTPGIKVAAVRALGGRVELVGESYQEAQAAATAISTADGRAFIAPYDDPYTIAGQGTIAAELLRETDMAALHAIFVAVGGGGLVAGIAAYAKALRPEIKVIGVEPAGANAMAQSLARGARVTLSKVDSFCDGVAVKQVGAATVQPAPAPLRSPSSAPPSFSALNPHTTRPPARHPGRR
jgi:threonine dehydratase